MNNIFTLVLTAGEAIRNGAAQAALQHPALYQILCIGMSDKATRTNWFLRFVRWTADNGKDWPLIGKGKRQGQPVGYQTVLRKSDEHAPDFVALAEYFNRFQAWLSAQDKVIMDQADNDGEQAVILTADDIVNTLRKVWDAVPEETRTLETRGYLECFALEAFGLDLFGAVAEDQEARQEVA